jgi:hypothetical protein
MEQEINLAPQSLNEAAYRAAAKLTTRLMDALQRTPNAQVDAATLQTALALAFEQGANWAADRACAIISAPVSPANRRPM